MLVVGMHTKTTSRFVAPRMTPLQWIIASSPTERKISYTELKNFKSTDNTMHALVDSGLGEPVGIALDRDRGNLYVADRMAQKIFRYDLLVEEDHEWGGETNYRLVVGGMRLTILAGRNVSYVAVDVSGDVFYSDESSNSVNRITQQVMNDIAAGIYIAEDLQVVSEKTQEATGSQAVSTNMLTVATDASTTDPPDTQPQILSIYEASVNPHVSRPGGVWSDGLNLFWTNQVNGTGAGSCMRGEVDPQPPMLMAAGDQPAAFPTATLSNISAVSHGVTKSNNFVFFSASDEGSGVVYGLSALDGGTAYSFATGLGEPRGLVWDGDMTVYVADTAAGEIWSFPIGRLIDQAPLTQTVAFNGAWGVALLSAEDEAFQNKVS